MKILLLLSLATLACSARLSINRPIFILEILRQRSLSDDFNDIERLIPERELEDLFRRYVLGDAEFQAIIRYMGSQDAYRAMEAIRSQPEIRELNTWLEEQLQKGRPIDDDDSSEELYQILNRRPAAGRGTLLRGWKGFMEELLAIYPRAEIRNLIRDKVAANGVFAEFWGRIAALRPVYERITELPEVRKFLDRLRELGVDTQQLDLLIREDLGWQIAGIHLIGGNQAGPLPGRLPAGAGGNAGAAGNAAGGAGNAGGAGGNAGANAGSRPIPVA